MAGGLRRKKGYLASDYDDRDSPRASAPLSVRINPLMLKDFSRNCRLDLRSL